MGVFSLKKYNVFAGVLGDIKLARFPVSISGCQDSENAHVMSELVSESGARTSLVIAADEVHAKKLYEDYRLFDRNVYFYPARDMIFYSADVHGKAIMNERLTALRNLVSKKQVTIITTFGACMDRLIPLNMIQEKVINIYSDTLIEDTAELSARLVAVGYVRVTGVTGPGEFAIRGDIIDIFPVSEKVPVRIELFGDEIDSMRRFDAATQRSIENISEISIYPAAEIILDEARRIDGEEKIRADLKKLNEALRKNMKTQEAFRLKSAVEQFLNDVEYLGALASIESYITYFYDNTVSLIDYFDEESLIFMEEPERTVGAGKAVYTEFADSQSRRLEGGYVLPGQLNAVYPAEEIAERLANKRLVLISNLPQKLKITEKKSVKVKENYGMSARLMGAYTKNFLQLASDIKSWKKKNYRIVIVSVSTARAERLRDDLDYNGITATIRDVSLAAKPKEVVLVIGALSRGFEYPDAGLVVVSESDIFGTVRRKKSEYSAFSEFKGTNIGSFEDLKVGDYVVHENHGMGIYKGIEKIESGGALKDYIKIEYAGASNLYIPAAALDKIQKYEANGARKPKLNKLGGKEWAETKARVERSVKDIAKELVALYSARQRIKGHVFSEDTRWQKEFEQLFPYEETHDQLKAIADVKKDMESEKVMDRLICGDVGYGKTEIAIRAAFKAVMDGKQVAVLTPTTILSQQHFNTFMQRMLDFPVTVEMMSRFRTSKQQKETIAKLKEGKVDIVIGTHRLLSKDVEFKNLGLLIVDEEQRFGVAHKERLKEMKNEVDVLTLSATPIPRTLHMSLAGIRDMSVLEEAPIDRLPIQTFVLEENEEIVREAITRELARGGQIYYVHNRINDIEEVTNAVKKLVPDAEIVFAHGQMPEKQLEKIMLSFVQGEIDVLISTTIIETGLDIPNVNTIIIDDAERFGLSGLYQLRGRVGRSARQGYAFLFYRRSKILTEIAEKRLSAIKEYTELGSGIKIAMKDLEIRGAGNLLGAEQSGHMAEVGYEMYCKLLNEAVKDEKGIMRDPLENFETKVDINIDAYIPDSYIPDEEQKLRMYKKIADLAETDFRTGKDEKGLPVFEDNPRAAIKKMDEACSDLVDELCDIYGGVPDQVQNLIDVVYIKTLFHRAYVNHIKQEEDVVELYVTDKPDYKTEKLGAVLEKFKGALVVLVPGKNETKQGFAYKLPKGTRNAVVIMRLLKEVANELQELI